MGFYSSCPALDPLELDWGGGKRNKERRAESSPVTGTAGWSSTNFLLRAGRFLSHVRLWGHIWRHPQNWGSLAISSLDLCQSTSIHVGSLLFPQPLSYQWSLQLLSAVSLWPSRWPSRTGPKMAHTNPLSHMVQSGPWASPCTLWPDRCQESRPIPVWQELLPCSSPHKAAGEPVSCLLDFSGGLRPWSVVSPKLKEIHIDLSGWCI